MTDLIYDYITQGVDLLVNAVILSAVILLLNSTRILNEYSANQQATSQRIGYYKEYAMYDNTSNLTVADVISAISRYNEDLEIVITHSKHHTIVYENDMFVCKCSNHAAGVNKYTSTMDNFRTNNATTKYYAYIMEDNNSCEGSSDSYQGGVITGIWFTTKPKGEVLP